MIDPKLEELLTWIEVTIQADVKTLKTFAIKFARSLDGTEKVDIEWDIHTPAAVLDRANRLYEVAARHQIYTEVAKVIRDGVSCEHLREHLYNKVLRHATPERSTSPAANLLHQEQGRAWASLLERLRFQGD